MFTLEAENHENTLKWVTRYVLIPVSLAVITGLFALEVIDREIASRQPHNDDVAVSIFATLTAVAPSNPPAANPEPDGTPTSEPTPTQEANLGAAGEPVAEAPLVNESVVGQTAVCGQIPTGWQRYTVQPGNTLYSLARQTGTSIAMIEQVNCLVGPLPAYAQIWLPTIPVAQPEPSLGAPDLTVTTPVGLPDLINNTDGWPTVSVSCPHGPGSCVTSVNLAVSNVGSADADLFNIQVWLDPAQSVVLNQTVERLLPGESVSFSLDSPPGGNCYDPDCTVCITVDSRSSVTEENEANNQFCTTFQG